MPIYTDKVTYGQSNTPSENHFIDGSTPNVLSIKRGTPLAPGAEVLKVNAGVVTFPQTIEPALVCSASETQNLTTGTPAALVLDSIATNVGFTQNSTSRYTPTVSGYYQITVGITGYCSATTLMYVALYISKNANVQWKTRDLSTTFDTTYLSLSGVVYFNGTTDYLECGATVSGASPTLSNSAKMTAVFLRK